MLNERAAFVADAYWASFFRCQPEQLFAGPLRIVTHGNELTDYDGVFALIRNGGAAVSIPPMRSESLGALLSSRAVECSFDSLMAALATEARTVVGPAYLGYAPELKSAPLHPVRELGPDDAAALRALEGACGEIEWATGGVSGELPCSGIFVGDELVAVASYEDWVGRIAHICVIAHRDFRGRGFGHSVVAHLAERALRAGLLPQYRTLESNGPSRRIAESLGFHLYAASLALLLNRLGA